MPRPASPDPIWTVRLASTSREIVDPPASGSRRPLPLRRDPPPRQRLRTSAPCIPQRTFVSLPSRPPLEVGVQKVFPRSRSFDSHRHVRLTHLATHSWPIRPL